MRLKPRKPAAPFAFAVVVLIVAVATPAVAGPAFSGHALASVVRINEVESNGGTPGDWIELVNTGAADADLSGWVLKDNDDTHAFTIGAGTSLAAGGHLAFEDRRRAGRLLPRPSCALAR